MTVQGVGASLSPALGAWLAQGLGYGPAFLILGSFAVVSVVLWLMFRSALEEGCATPQATPEGSAESV